MNYKDYEKFVINYKPFDWEIDHSDFRENIKGKHSLLINFIRFYRVSLYLQQIIKEENLQNPKIIDVGSFPGNMVMLSSKIFNNVLEYYSIGLNFLYKRFKKKANGKVWWDRKESNFLPSRCQRDVLPMNYCPYTFCWPTTYGFSYHVHQIY